MIRVENLFKHFGRTRAVDGISFSVERGEVVGFLGPNGAGKTTTLRVLTCYHPATRGRAEVAGYDVYRSPVQVRRNIGYLAENVPIYPELRVEQYLRYRAALKGVPRRQRATAVESALERCGVLDVRRKLVAHVSRGYRQRVGLADALVARPPILILDEPTAGLDPNQRRRMKALVRELAEEHTILFSSHILPEVEDVSSRILVIHDGVLRADDTPEGMLQKARGRVVSVTAMTDEATLFAAVEGIEGLTRPGIEAADGGHLTLEAHLAADVDPRDVVSQRLRDAGVPIRELKLVLPRLEDYFQQITEGSTPGPGSVVEAKP